MSGETHKSHIKEYLIIFVVLAVLTALELMVPELNTAYSLKASALVLLAIAKAFVVAWWYMHLNEEKKWLWFIAAIPISAAVYTVVLILESMYR